MEFEAGNKKLVYEKVDSENAKQIEDASFCEREGFGTGLDPQELPPVLQFIAKHGHIWLQYVVENGQCNPTGVIEFIPLVKVLGYRPKNIDPGEYDLSISPLTIIMENQDRVFSDVRRFAKDENIVYYHGIAMSRKGKGYGTLLMKHALENTPYTKNNVVVCFPDAAQIDEESNELQLAPNEDSFTLHLKARFVLAGVVDPPVYDETLTYFSFVKPLNRFGFPMRDYHQYLNLAEGDARSVIERARELTGEAFLGEYYNKKTHKMEFQKLHDYGPRH